MRPVFIFGTGRCGSTHLQRVVTLRSDVWVWGEHDGFLAPLLNGVSRYENSAQLSKNVFQTPRKTDEELLEAMTKGSPQLPWLNRFEKTAVRREVAFTIDRLFRTPLPDGWTEWGFKEIQYGFSNNAPRLLLELFPGGSAAFSFRHPQLTIESMVRSWDGAVLSDESKVSELRAAFSGRAERWRTIMTFFIEFKKEQNDRLVFVPVQALDRAPDAILEKLRLQPRKEGSSLMVPLTNRGGRSVLPDWAKPVTDALYEQRREDLEEIHRQAVEIGSRDLGLPLADDKPQPITASA